MTKIGILGSGDVGQVLSKGFAQHGHEVMLGTRDVAKLRGFSNVNPDVQVGHFSEAASFGETLILATAGWAAVDCLHMCDPQDLEGKLIIDSTNPIQKDAIIPPTNGGGVVEFFRPDGGYHSLMEALVAEFPKAHFVKGFNCVGNQFMIDPDFGEGRKSTMFICGNNERAKAQATRLIEEVGHDVQDFGPASVAGPIESLCQLWCARGFNKGQWNHAFAVILQNQKEEESS